MEDELYHYGVKGMKWGVRKDRYDNYYREMDARDRRREHARRGREAAKNRAFLSDEELDARITRLRKENELRRLTEENYNQGRNAAYKLLEQYGKQVISASVGVVSKSIADEVIAPIALESIQKVKSRKASKSSSG
jgi:hypothetical protein